MKKLWSLFNKADKLRIDHVTSEQVRTILLAVPSGHMNNWYICTEGDVHWQPLSSIPEFYEEVHEVKGSATMLKAVSGERRTPLFEDAPDDFKTNPALLVEKTQAAERRSARRYERRLSFSIDFENIHFKSETKNISMTGISIKTPLPANLPKTFWSTLSDHQYKVKVLCKKISPSKLKILEVESWDPIRTWIVNW